MCSWGIPVMQLFNGHSVILKKVVEWKKTVFYLIIKQCSCITYILHCQVRGSSNKLKQSREGRMHNSTKKKTSMRGWRKGNYNAFKKVSSQSSSCSLVRSFGFSFSKKKTALCHFFLLVFNSPLNSLTQ